MRSFKTIVIVGLGLMGGSLAAACRKKFPRARILGVSRNRRALRTALRKKWIHGGTPRLEQAAKAADLIVLCTPVDTFPKYFSRLDCCVRPGTLVTDVGSVKHEMLRVLGRKRPKNLRFVGAHPMAGSHRRGIESAAADLYDGGMTFLIRGGKTKPKDFSAVRTFWKKITPRLVTVSAEAHDRIVADVSHLPHAVAVALMLSIDARMLPFTAKGFRDTTRVAQGPPSIWLPIFFGNRMPVLRALARFEKNLKRFRAAVSSPRKDALLRILEKARGKRIRISL